MRYLGGKVIEVWHKEDVQEAARQQGVTLSDEECETVLFYMVKYYDASIGCNWFYIQSMINHVKRCGILPAEILSSNIDYSIEI